MSIRCLLGLHRYKASDMELKYMGKDTFSAELPCCMCGKRKRHIIHIVYPGCQRDGEGGKKVWPD